MDRYTHTTFSNTQLSFTYRHLNKKHKPNKQIIHNDIYKSDFTVKKDTGYNDVHSIKERNSSVTG